MTPTATRRATANDGRLIGIAICCALRTSLARAEMMMPIQIDHAATSGVKKIWAAIAEPRSTAAADCGSANTAITATTSPKTR